MEPLPLKKFLEVTRGRWVASGPPSGSLVSEVSTDSRTLPASSIFVALKGDRFDGHAYVEDAFRNGALASVVSDGRIGDLPRAAGPYIGVSDPLEAFEAIAAWNRARLSLTVVGVTGSVGKTSTKEFLATVLSDAFRVHCAPRSFNNRIGVATTLIMATPETEVLVAELGASAPGEIAQLARLVRPHKVVVTEIAPAHLDGFGDLDGVARAKAEIFEGLEDGGVSFLKHGIHGFEQFAAAARGPLKTYGWDGGDYRVTDCQKVSLGRDVKSDSGHGDYGYLFSINGQQNFLLPVPGRHNVVNAAAVIAVARDLGMRWEEIRSSLAECRLPPLRLQVLEQGGVVLVDDSYNANPVSMDAAIGEWVSLGREHGGDGGAAAAADSMVAVLGDMLEMGRDSRRLHEDVGERLARKTALRLLVTVGDDSRHLGESFRRSGGSGEVVHFDSVAEAMPFLKTGIRPGDHVLFKASRRIGLDGAVAKLCKWLAPPLPALDG